MVPFTFDVVQVCFHCLLRRHPGPGGGGGRYSQKNLVGVCSPLPKTLTLFMTKICDVPYPIYDLTFNQNPFSDQRYNKFPASSDQC